MITVLGKIILSKSYQNSVENDSKLKSKQPNSDEDNPIKKDWRGQVYNIQLNIAHNAYIYDLFEYPNPFFCCCLKLSKLCTKHLSKISIDTI